MFPKGFPPGSRKTSPAPLSQWLAPGPSISRPDGGLGLWRWSAPLKGTPWWPPRPRALAAFSPPRGGDLPSAARRLPRAEAVLARVPHGAGSWRRGCRPSGSPGTGRLPPLASRARPRGQGPRPFGFRVPRAQDCVPARLAAAAAAAAWASPDPCSRDASARALMLGSALGALGGPWAAEPWSLVSSGGQPGLPSPRQCSPFLEGRGGGRAAIRGSRDRLIKGNNPPTTPEGPFPDPRAPSYIYNLSWGWTGSSHT